MRKVEGVERRSATAPDCLASSMIKIANTPRHCALEVVLGSGRRIEVRRDFVGETSRRVVELLAEI
jgi:hypothetical protein